MIDNPIVIIILLIISIITWVNYNELLNLKHDVKELKQIQHKEGGYYKRLL